MKLIYILLDMLNQDQVDREKILEILTMIPDVCNDDEKLDDIIEFLNRKY